MLNASWATLLRQIPADQHDTLIVRTANGTEITVQTLLRIDYEFVIVRGRLAGTQDQGRLFILPYANIDYFGVNRLVKDEDFNALFAGVVIPEPGARPTEQGPAVSTAAVTHATLLTKKAALTDAAMPPVKPSRVVAPPVKSSVLERFRTRNNGGEFGD
jgi:hypothetical protein